MTDSEKCCPVFDPSPYEDKVIEWKDKLFVKDSMRTRKRNMVIIMLLALRRWSEQHVSSCRLQVTGCRFQVIFQIY